MNSDFVPVFGNIDNKNKYKSAPTRTSHFNMKIKRKKAIKHEISCKRY